MVSFQISSVNPLMSLRKASIKKTFYYYVDLKNLKNWEWYSSKIINNGLEIIVKDSFYPRYIWIFHCQNIPLSKFWLEDDKFGNYGIETIRDVTTYKKFKSL